MVLDLEERMNGHEPQGWGVSSAMVNDIGI